MPIISGSGGGGGIPSAGAAGQVVGFQSAGVGQWVFPPGFEIGYDQITATVNVVGTTSGTATTLITAAAHTFDGAPVMCQVFFFSTNTDSGAAGHNTSVGLFESGALVTRIGLVQTPAAAQMGVPVPLFWRFTPSAASHTYTVAAWVTATTGTPAIFAGAGLAGADSPGFVRFTKV